jgi:hypothetical protein
MIWFLCKKCNKAHGRADSSAGTMIFCECGQGNTVPWESTTSELASPPMVDVPKVPDLAPIQFDPVKGTPAPPSDPSKRPTSYPPTSSSPPPIEDEERPYRRGRTEKRDPDFCFNHQRRPRVEACADCEENFCTDCLVKFQGSLLCGPCKNFRARREELPPASSAMASASLIISLIAGPLMMCLLINSPSNNPIRVLSLLSLLPQLLALALGLWALREAEKERKGGGQWMAITGVATSSMTCVLMLLLQVYANKIAA